MRSNSDKRPDHNFNAALISLTTSYFHLPHVRLLATVLGAGAKNHQVCLGLTCEVYNFALWPALVLAQGMDAVIVQPVDASATGPMTKAVLKAGKALVYVNRKPANVPKGVLFCGSNSIDSGIMSMEELGKCMGGKGNLAILMGELSNEATIARTDGVKKVIKEKFPDIKVTREQTANWTREQAKNPIRKWWTATS
jgi:DNA-binding LacI/PurR family transcriptional regulator